jgi:hypothetical protein
MGDRGGILGYELARVRGDRLSRADYAVEGGSGVEVDAR